jgi:amino acid adenylation domain-containing protein
MDKAHSMEAFAFAASFAQEQFWLVDQLDPGDPANNIGTAVRLRGVLDLAALRQSLNAVVQRHEALRTTFSVIQGRITQLVWPNLQLGIRVVAGASFCEGDFEQAIVLCGKEVAAHRFNLSRGPLIHPVLLKGTAEDHVFFLTIHHIIADGWSMTILIRELMEFYRAFKEGKNAAPAPPLLQYADYAEWQKNWLTDAVWEKETVYWKEKLSDIPSLELPSDYSRPALLGHEGRQKSVMLSPELSSSLVRLGRQSSATLYMVLLAGFKILLHRYTGVADVVVGSAFAGRHRPRLEDVVGCFVNVVVLRTDLSGDPTVLEVLSRIREETLDAQSHADVPFEKVLHEFKPDRDPSRTPFFQIFFNMLNFPTLDPEFHGVEAEVRELPDVGSKFDLTLYIEEKENRIRCHFVYNPLLFRAERISEMLGQYEFVLKQMVRNPLSKISSISLVTSNARQVLPDPTIPLDASWQGSVAQLFRKHVLDRPNSMAVSGPGCVWSYRDLERFSNRLANHLLHCGIQPDDVVVIYAHRSAPLACALLSVLKAGAAFLILDPAYPASRLLQYVQIAQPAAWLQLEGAGPVPAELQSLVTSLPLKCRFNLPPATDLEWERVLAQFPQYPVDPPVGGDSRAYISFTSGSTGTPKAVLGRHGSLSHFVPWFEKEFSLGPGDRFTVFSALSHDPLHRDVLLPLMLGACVCFPDPSALQNPARAVEWMRETGITVTNLTPAAGQLLLQGTMNTGTVLSSLRHAFYVGDILVRGDIHSFYNFAPLATCVNLYGATETQRAVSFLRVPRYSGAESVCLPKQVLPLGHGIPDVQLLVLNENQQQAGIGEAGEIYFRSPHMGLGYLHDPELTQTKFLKNWFTTGDDDRLYRTGDLGRYLLDGSVECLGRADQQVKIRGFRIELGEIEALLKQHANVKSGAVILHETTPGDKQITAYAVLHRAHDGWEGELRRHLEQQLPEYMVPAAFVRLDALPLTANGKLDRRALPPPEHRLERCTLPETALEREVASIMQQVLNVPLVGVYDNFFRLGGHSLLAIQFLSRLESAFHVKISFQDFFRGPSIRSLAPLIVEAQVREADPEMLAAILSDLEQSSDGEKESPGLHVY